MEDGRTEHDLGEIFRKFGGEYEKTHNLTSEQRKTLRAISVCRTSYPGGHIEKCENCGYEHPVYNSCRNPNCPKCQGIERRRWVEKRLSELLPVPYFHIVFTLPQFLSELYFYNQFLIGGILFRSSADTVLHLSMKYIRAVPYIVSLLHSWGQTMSRHVHVHMLVTSGGLNKSGTQWKSYSSNYLFDVYKLSDEFRKRFMLRFAEEFNNGKIILPYSVSKNPVILNELLNKDWVVNCRRPFAGAETVIKYLGRYTYRTAISNRRLLDVSEDAVTFDYKDYRDTDRNGVSVHRVMKLHPDDFISRFLQHIPPKGFRKIRFYGIAGGGHRKIKLQLAKQLLANFTDPDVVHEITETEHFYTCPTCGSINFIISPINTERSPPFKFRNEREKTDENAA